MMQLQRVFRGSEMEERGALRLRAEKNRRVGYCIFARRGRASSGAGTASESRKNFGGGG